MKKTFFAAAALALLAGPALAVDIPEGCTPAVQNWVNGSGFTCAKSDNGGDKFKRPEAEAEAATAS